MNTTLQPNPSLLPLLRPFQQAAETAIRQHIDSLPSQDRLHAAYAYALTNGGKRFRPAAVFMIADALGNSYNVTNGALAIELCHTASLIADDLPMMDNDDFRREKPSLHRAFDEATALLTSYAMIANAYACIAANTRELEKTNHPHSAAIGLLALECASYNTGLAGATGGQFIDLFPTKLDEQTLLEIIHKKTVSLFEVAFVLGWLFGGGDAAQLPLVKEAASHFGIAFQIADDLDDLQQDANNGHVVNYAALCGENEARRLFHKELHAYLDALNDLGIASPAMKGLVGLLQAKLP